jgi:hypothetical protein
MASLSTYLKNKIADGVLRNVTYTFPTTVYLGLFLTDPTNDNTGTEVSGGSYARLPLTFGAASGGVSITTADVIYSTATVDWGTIVYGGIYDAVSGGNLLFHSAFNAPKLIKIGDIFKILAGDLVNNFS